MHHSMCINDLFRKKKKSISQTHYYTSYVHKLCNKHSNKNCLIVLNSYGDVEDCTITTTQNVADYAIPDDMPVFRFGKHFFINQNCIH